MFLLRKIRQFKVYITQPYELYIHLKQYALCDGIVTTRSEPVL